MSVHHRLWRYCTVACTALLLCSGNSWGQSLEQQITQRLQAQHPGTDITFDAHILQPAPTLCDEPQLYLAGENQRLTGNFSFRANCNGKNHFVQVQVQATGYYLVAKQPLEAGRILQASDIQRHPGKLEKLPTDLVFQNEDVTGYILLRHVAAGEPLEHRIMRKPWRVHSGQRVSAVATGDGFSIHRQGKAMGNAAINDSVRVRMASGKAVVGLVGKDGVIYVNE